MSGTGSRKKTGRKTSSSTTDRATLYAEAVSAGRIIAGPHVRNACCRHLEDLKRKDIRYDPEAAARALRFFESKLYLSEGQFEGRPFKSEPAQDFIIGSLFGWKRLDGTRRFRRAYVEQGKGNGKSPLAGGIGLYGLMADGEAGAEIYSAGATKEQASVLFRDAVKMVRKSPDLDSRLVMSGGPGREFNIAYLHNSSFFRPVSREAKKTGSGPRPHMALIDEYHEHPDDGVVQTLERGFKFRRQPLIFIITNSGSDRNSACWVEHEHAIKVAAGNRNARDDDADYVGEVVDDTAFSYVCALDEGDDPLTDPSCWIKANPLLGATITPEYLGGVVAQARNLPTKLNGILRLHFCVWTDADEAWMSSEVLNQCLADFDPLDHRGDTVYLGLDLSQNKDITAKATVVRTGVVGSGPHAGKPIFDAWIDAWTPGDTAAARETRDKQPYTLWISQGFLNGPPGQSINFRQVAQSIAEDVSLYSVECCAYDRYAFKRFFEPECHDLGIEVEFVEHPQGGVKKGKPTEAMEAAAEDAERDPEGLWMPGSVRALEEVMLEGRIRLRRNPVLVSAIMSAVVARDPWGNHWLAKDKSINKIDSAVALAMALGAAVAYEGSGGVSVFDLLAEQFPAEPVQETEIDEAILNDPRHPRWKEMRDLWEAKNLSQDEDDF